MTGLQKGRTEAHEMDPVLPVDDATVDGTLPFLNRHVCGLVEFQRLTGCRPGKACSIRRCDIDTCSAVWLYKPPHHKTAHRGKSRTIAIGPRAQELLKQFFTTSIDDFLFSPILQILASDTKATRKQRHTAKRIWQRLRDEQGFSGGYTVVKDALRAIQLGRKEVFLPLNWWS